MNKKKTEKLKYVMTIPSVDFVNYVAITDLMLLGSNDKRYQDLKKQNPVLKQYLDSFRTPFGKTVNPSIVVRDESMPKVDVSHLCAFRNAIAIAAVIGARTLSYINNEAAGHYCTDLFDFYPVSVSNDGTDLVARTAFENSFCCSVDNFARQPTPAVVYPENIDPAVDDKFTLALLDVVESRPRRTDEKTFKNKVIRSMEMAYYAMRSPFVTLGEPSDFGVLISLWVSAFEILANPHGAKVHFSDVSTMIKAVPWRDRKLRVRNLAAVGPKKGEKTTLPVQIYGRLYQTRNAYMHGVAMRKGEYEFCRRKGWGNLFFQAPSLYRSVLMNTLNSRGFGELLAQSEEHGLYEKVLLRKDK
jgi:hypothetical protein